MQKKMAGDQEEWKAERKADLELLAKLDGHQARTEANHGPMMTCLGETEAYSEEIESESQNREVPKKRAAVKPVGGPSKRHTGRNPDPETNWPPPAEG
jgi:hypothetical protein